MNTLLLLA